MKTTVYIDIDGRFSKKFHRISIFIPGPVRVRIEAGPGLVAAGLVPVIVGVGSLLNGQIEPVAGPAIRPDIHAGQQIAGVLREPVQHPVDHGHGLGAGDIGVRAEGAVLDVIDTK